MKPCKTRLGPNPQQALTSQRTVNLGSGPFGTPAAMANPDAGGIRGRPGAALGEARGGDPVNHRPSRSGRLPLHSSALDEKLSP